MGTIWDLTKRSSLDYVDNPFWSAFQIKVRSLGETQDHPISD